MKRFTKDKDRTKGYLCESCCTVMHDRASIIGGTEMINLSKVIFKEVVLHARHDVIPHDGDVVISISSTLFMPKPRCMHQLMHHNT